MGIGPIWELNPSLHPLLTWYMVLGELIFKQISAAAKKILVICSCAAVKSFQVVR